MAKALVSRYLRWRDRRAWKRFSALLEGQGPERPVKKWARFGNNLAVSMAILSAIRAITPQHRESKRVMAQKIQTLFIDDIDGSEADGTVRFGLDGTDYEIDLNPEHDSELRKVLMGYIPFARRASSSRGAASPRTRIGGRRLSQAASGTHSTVEIRAWASRNGYPQLGDRGRIPELIVADFEKHGGRDKVSVENVPAAPATPATEPTPAVFAEEVFAEAPATVQSGPAKGGKKRTPPAAPEAEPAEAVRTANGYGPELKARAVRMAQEGTIAGTARELGISAGSLRNWIKEATKAAV